MVENPDVTVPSHWVRFFAPERVKPVGRKSIKNIVLRPLTGENGIEPVFGYVEADQVLAYSWASSAGGPHQVPQDILKLLEDTAPPSPAGPQAPAPARDGHH